MRAQVYTGTPLDTEHTSDIPGIWTEYAPRTNLIWLLFLLKNLLKNRRPEPGSVVVQLPSQSPRKPLAPRSSNRRGSMRKPTWQKQSEQNSKPLAVEPREQRQQAKYAGVNGDEAVLQVPLFKKVLEERLLSVLELLNLEHGHEEMCCAADLVAYAIDEGWLDEKDFF